LFALMQRRNDMSSNPIEETSGTLLASARLGRKEAWERIDRLYGPLIERWCQRWGAPAREVADIRQEVLTAVAKHLHEFDPAHPKGSFRGWLRTITLNAVRHHFRLQQRRGLPAPGGTSFHEQLQLLESPDFDSDSDEECESSILRRALEMLRGEFAEHRWAAFWRFTIDEQPVADVASELRMTPGAVRKAKFDVLKRLQVEFAGLVHLR
jgi:RNA polymerase sigma-70 factor (ECF subfamily)